MHVRLPGAPGGRPRAGTRRLHRAGLAVGLMAAFALLSACDDYFSSIGSRSRHLVVVGDSLSSGHQNGCTVHGQQEHGYAKVLADQAGWRLDLPLISSPGIRPCMAVQVDGNPATIVRIDANGDPFPDINDANDPSTWGTRLNPGVQPTDLGTPGTRVVDAFSEPPDDSFHFDLGFGLHYEAIWRSLLDTPDKSPDQSMAKIAVGLLTASETDRDVAILWLGSNDALWSAIGGTGDAVTPPEYFEPAFTGMLGLLAMTGAEIVVANVPDLTVAPHFMSKSDAVTWAGCDPGGVNSGDLVTLAGLWTAKAICDGLIAGPLSENEVLTPAEVTLLQDAIAGYNAVIADASSSVGAALVDIATLLADADVNGYPIGPDTLTTDYCGGVFSLDGVHPTNTGYAVVANAFIAAMNEQLGYAIPPVNVAAVWANEPAKNLCVAVP